MVQAVRGAVQIAEDIPELIISEVCRMVQEIMSAAFLSEEDIISIQFTVTDDLISKNPAAALRVKGYADVPLFCCAEPRCEGMMPRMVRTLVTFNTERKRNVNPVYLNGAEKLRPDIFK